jgi:hypothetical protein
VSSVILYTVTAPVALSNIEKQPSTFAESKYFLKLLSILALLTEQEEKIIAKMNKHDNVMITCGYFFFINFNSKN